MGGQTEGEEFICPELLCARVPQGTRPPTADITILDLQERECQPPCIN